MSENEGYCPWATMPEPEELVLATRFRDGDPAQDWVVGRYAGRRVINNFDEVILNPGVVAVSKVLREQRPLHLVREPEIYMNRDSPTRGELYNTKGYKYISHIRMDVAHWLLSHEQALRMAPYGQINLWRMFNPSAFARIP